MLNNDKKEPISTPTKKAPNKQITINTTSTQYELITKISKKFKWKIKDSEDEDDSDLYWFDLAVQPERFCKLKPYQKINHFPSMHELARKNFLTKNLNKMKKTFPNDFLFYPKTWLYPSEFSKLKLKYNKNSIYIVKPEASSQGRGIFLTKTLEGFEENERYVVQEYIKNPLLIDGLKFDLRVYVLVAGCDPLKIFVHKEGLARFATELYSAPGNGNLHKSCMHLTNYAINKTSEKFVFNENSEKDDVGHKQSLKAALCRLEALGFNTEDIWNEIKAIVVKSLTTVQPALAHVYRACQPDDPYNGMCFEILGFDIILDETGKCWLLEVNHSPSFNIDSPLDLKIKETVISEALVLLNVAAGKKKEYEERKKKQILLRTLGRNKDKEKLNKINDFKLAQNRRDLWENEHLGGFERAFPDDKFNKFLEAAQKIWVECTGGKLPQKELRPQTQQSIHKVPEKSKTLCESPKRVDLEVFQRLYNTKKIKVDPPRFSPCFQLDETYRELYLKNEMPYKYLKLSMPVQEKTRFKSTPKKRISYNQQLEEFFKDRQSLKRFKKTFHLYETPLKIFSMATDERIFKDRQKAKFFRENVLRKLF